MPRTMTIREKRILFLTLAVVIAGVAYKYFISSSLERSLLLNQEIALAQAKLKKYLTLLSRREMLMAGYGQFYSQLNGPNQSGDDLILMLSELELAAKQAGIDLIDVRPQTQAVKSPAKESFADVKARGTIEAYMKFLYNLESPVSLLKVKRLVLNAKPRTQILEGNLSISRINTQH